MRTTDCIHLNMELSRLAHFFSYLSFYISLDFCTVYEGIHQEIEEF